MEQEGMIENGHCRQEAIPRLILQSGGRYLAPKEISKDHVLRVIYRREGIRYIVITFYPRRRERYED